MGPYVGEAENPQAVGPRLYVKLQLKWLFYSLYKFLITTRYADTCILFVKSTCMINRK